MIEPAGSTPPKSRRPAWFAGPTQMEFDCRTDVSAPTLQELLRAAERLSPGQIFAVRSGGEPVLLCRILANRGFSHWPEDDGEGGHRSLFLKAPPARS